jgi:hypothetical protein
MSGRSVFLPCSSWVPGARSTSVTHRDTQVDRGPPGGHGRCAEAPGSPTFPASPSPMSGLARRLTGPSPFRDGVPVLGSPEGDQGQRVPRSVAVPHAGPSRKSDFVTSLRRLSHEPLTSRASRWRPQPARAAIETPGTHLGRPLRPRAPARTAAMPPNPAAPPPNPRTTPYPPLTTTAPNGGVFSHESASWLARAARRLGRPARAAREQSDASAALPNAPPAPSNGGPRRTTIS